MEDIEPGILAYPSQTTAQAIMPRWLKRIQVLGIALLLLAIAAFVVPSFFHPTCCTMENATLSAVSDYGPIATAIKVYQLHTGHYPAKLQDLVIKPVGETNWKGPYIEDLRKLDDPWDNSYQYRHPGLKSRPYDLWSMGPDTISGTADDITG